MTLLGKILVFLNLVMACLFLGFAVMVFQSRVDYQGKVAESKKKADDAQNEVSGVRLKLTEKATEAENLTRALDAQKEATKKAQAETKSVTEQLQSDYSKVSAQLTPQNQQLINATAEMKRRKDEVDQLRDERTKLVERNTKLTDDLTATRDELALKKNEHESLKARTDQLYAENNQIRAWIARKGMTLPELADLIVGDEVPAPPEVKGVVTQVDSSGKLMQISIGEDDGIRKGQVLEIWRTKPEPKYVGTARISFTTARAAVAIPVKVTGLVLKDDEIGPKSMINR